MQPHIQHWPLQAPAPLTSSVLGSPLGLWHPLFPLGSLSPGDQLSFSSETTSWSVSVSGLVGTTHLSTIFPGLSLVLGSGLCKATGGSLPSLSSLCCSSLQTSHGFPATLGDDITLLTRLRVYLPCLTSRQSTSSLLRSGLTFPPEASSPLRLPREGDPSAPAPLPAGPSANEPPLSPAGSALLVYSLSLFRLFKKQKQHPAPPISPRIRNKILKTPVNTGCLHFLISHSLFSALLWLPAPSSPRNCLGQGYHQAEPNPTINARCWLLQHPISGTSSFQKHSFLSAFLIFPTTSRTTPKAASSVLTTRIP